MLPLRMLCHHSAALWPQMCNTLQLNCLLACYFLLAGHLAGAGPGTTICEAKRREEQTKAWPDSREQQTAKEAPVRIKLWANASRPAAAGIMLSNHPARGPTPSPPARRRQAWRQQLHGTLTLSSWAACLPPWSMSAAQGARDAHQPSSSSCALCARHASSCRLLACPLAPPTSP